MVTAVRDESHPPASRMAYFSLLNLHREPFSNSPDPGLFFRSAQHAECLQKLELAIRLRRGLNIVQGEIGAGKTTLCRHLIQSVAGEACMDIHLLLDPAFSDELELLQVLLQQMVGASAAAAAPASAAACKERIQQHLFQRAVEEDRIIVLIVDEAQKLTPIAVEVLRELLNYETNDHKLLQIVLFGQLELDAVLKRHPNFVDRANLIHTLEPMDAADVGAYIRFRLEQSELPDRDRPSVVFTAGAIQRIAEVTGGYPRKINHLCHNLLLLLIVRGQHKVTRAMVEAASGRYRWSLGRWPRTPLLLAAGLLLTVGVSATTALLVTKWTANPGGPAVSVVSPPGVVSGSELDSRAWVSAESAPAEVMDPALTPDVADSGLLYTNGEDPSWAEDSIGDVGVVAGQHARVAASVSAGSPARVPADAASDWLWPLGVDALLGSVTLQTTDSVSEMASRIFGRSSHRLIQAIRRSNSEFTDLNRIQLGDQVRFPLIRLVSAESAGMFWIERGRFPDLDTAYQVARTEGPGVLRVLAVMSTTNAFDFRVVQRLPAASRLEAEQRLSTLPPAQSGLYRVAEFAASDWLAIER
jgi:general secretion pathway protein A